MKKYEVIGNTPEGEPGVTFSKHHTYQAAGVSVRDAVERGWTNVYILDTRPEESEDQGAAYVDFWKAQGGQTTMKEQIIQAINETRAHSVERAHRIENIVDSAFAGIDYPIDIYCEDLQQAINQAKRAHISDEEWLTLVAEDLEKAINEEVAYYRQYVELNNQTEEEEKEQ